MGIFTYWPNRITALRFVGALVLFGILAIVAERPPEELGEARSVIHLAFWLFVVTAATDFLDGYLARSGNVVTAFGRIADPFVDKVLILGAMIFLAVLPWSNELLPAWMVVIILAREFLVTGIRGYVESIGSEFPADRFGKLKMVLQCCAVGGLLWMEAFEWAEAWSGFWRELARYLVWATLVTTLGSGITYVLKTRQILARASA